MVIQRWQSLLLLVAVVMMALFSFASLGQVQTEDFSLNFSAMGFTYEGEPTDGAPCGTFLHTWFFFVLSITTAVLTLIDIFLYKNLTLQMRVCAVAILFIIADMAVAAGIGYYSVEGNAVSWSSVAICPFVALIACIMARGRMNRDRKLLNSVDRLR